MLSLRRNNTTTSSSSRQEVSLSSLFNEIMQLEECQAQIEREALAAFFASGRRRSGSSRSLSEQVDALHLHAEEQRNCQPASKSSIRSLPKCRVFSFFQEQHKDDTRECGICCNRLIDGIILTRLPCGHVYHINCIVPWFNQAHTCPECRYEMPTMDYKNEKERQARMAKRPTVSCKCNPVLRHHTCFFDESQLVVCQPCPEES